MERQLFGADHEAFRKTVRAFRDQEIVPPRGLGGGGIGRTMGL